MDPKNFLAQLDDAKIVAEIASAERRTSGEIRVFVSDREVDDVIARAERRFEKLGMTKTQQRNGVLLYFAPRSRKFAVVGDLGIHEKCGPAFWEEVSTKVREQLRTAHFTEAVILGVRKVGEVLARHFPRAESDRDELSNKVERD